MDLEFLADLEGGMFFPFLILIAGEVLFADVLLLPNGMSKVGANM